MHSEEKESAPPVEIPMEALNSETLRAVIESFILREGTDYGWQEADHDTKIEQIKRQLQNGKIKIAFDPASESVTILTANEWKKLVASRA
jgi:hypothetical protein